MPKKKSIEMRKQLRKENIEGIRKLNAELLKQYSNEKSEE